MDDGVAIRMTCYMAGRWNGPVFGEELQVTCGILTGHPRQRRRKATNVFHATMPSLRLSSGVPELAEEPGVPAS